jgi:RNA polymerase sigma-70 factor (ECF subfamily)
VLSSEAIERPSGENFQTPAARRASFDPHEATDRELLAAHVAGDRDAFGVLFRRHQRHLYQLALRTCRAPEDAADCLQEALLSAHRNAATFRGDAEVRSWLHRIVLNSCLDRIRRNKTRPVTTLSESIDEPRTDCDDIARHEMKMVVDAALLALPDDQRVALIAVDMEGYTVAEAAQLLGVAEGTIKSRCSRGRKRLQQELKFLRNPGNRT